MYYKNVYTLYNIARAQAQNLCVAYTIIFVTTNLHKSNYKPEGL